MLTARGEEFDKVLGLELGADDYVTKPVGVRELMARIKAVLRRGELAPAAGTVLEFGKARIDFDRYEATVDGRTVHLSPKAFGVLRLLWESKGRALTRAQILEQVWGYECTPPRARWTTTSPNCATAWKPTRPSRATSSRYTGSDTALWSEARKYNLFACP